MSQKNHKIIILKKINQLLSSGSIISPPIRCPISLFESSKKSETSKFLMLIRGFAFWTSQYPLQEQLYEIQSFFPSCPMKLCISPQSVLAYDRYVTNVYLIHIYGKCHFVSQLASCQYHDLQPSYCFISVVVFVIWAGSLSPLGKPLSCLCLWPLNWLEFLLAFAYASGIAVDPMGLRSYFLTTHLFSQQLKVPISIQSTL